MLVFDTLAQSIGREARTMHTAGHRFRAGLDSELAERSKLSQRVELLLHHRLSYSTILEFVCVAVMTVSNTNSHYSTRDTVLLMRNLMTSSEGCTRLAHGPAKLS